MAYRQHIYIRKIITLAIGSAVGYTNITDCAWQWSVTNINTKTNTNSKIHCHGFDDGDILDVNTSGSGAEFRTE